MEKNCKWYFDKSGQALTGPNDAIRETFKANPYYSIVRESIQNSLDVVLNKSQPVKVVFSFEKLAKQDYPNLFNIEQHIVACLQTHKDDRQAEKLFHPMVEYISRNSCFEVLKISDYNTIGMEYSPGNYNSSFTSFLRGEGKSSKNNQGSGGSFGFGKGAYFVLSKIKTLLVSTKASTGEVFFEGRTRLATHEMGNETYTRDGFYNQAYDKPVNNLDDIPDYFKRTKPGTDIFIVGLIKLEDRKIQMVKSVLNNFWLAVHDNELVVQIDDVLIEKNNLEQIIDNYFPDEIEKGSATDIESWNPKPYFKAVKYATAKAGEQFKVFHCRLDTLGEVKLYIYLEKGLPNRTSYFRKPKMVVFKKTNRKVQGYAAVFLCDNAVGNVILKEMENPAHNEWKKGNYVDDNDEPHPDAKNAEKEINQFITSKLEELSKTDSGKNLTFLGLEEYLAIPEDLLQQEETYDAEGNRTNSTSGNLSGDLSEGETAETSTIIKVDADKKKDDKDDDVDDDIDDNEEAKREIKVNLKVAAESVDGKLYHNLIIGATKDVSHAELKILVGADNDRNDSLEIQATDVGEISKNVIKNLKLNSGRNLIKIRFADNIKHSVKIKAYELQ